MRNIITRGLIAVLALTITTAFVGVSALQEETTPEWLVRSDSSFNLITFDLFTEEGEVAQDEFYDNFVSFSIDTASYVYIFNVGAPNEDGSRDVHMLFPNAIDTESYVQPGEYSISPEFILDDVPTGEAYIQGFATPFPVNVRFDENQEFTFQGNDPELFFRGIEFDIESQGVLSTEYAADWATYAVRGGGLEAFAAGSRCTKVRISVPNATADTIVSYSIDENCINGQSLTGTFKGPVSSPIAQVLEGTRTITVNASGFETTEITANAEFGSTSIFQVTPEALPDVFELGVSNLAPSIFEELVFTPFVQTSRPIENYTFDFGDDSGASFTAEEFNEMGSINHTYFEGTEPGFLYRVTMTIRFSDGGEPEIASINLPVDFEPTPGSCPPDSIIAQNFARSILLETEGTGCITIEVPEHLIDQSALTHEGAAELINQFNWESLPDEAIVQAIATITYRDTDGQATGTTDKFSMLKDATGTYTLNPRIEVPANSNIELDISFVVKNNPSFSRIALEAGPFELKSITNCSGATLFPSNANSNSEGAGISFRGNQLVELIFENTGCTDITLSRGTLVISRNGEDVAVIGNASDTISVNRFVSWTWNQRDNNGVQVIDGEYTATIQTDQGEYTTHFKIFND